MKKNGQLRYQLIRIMRITSVHLLFIFLSVAMLEANNGYGQKILKKKLSIKLDKAELVDALEDIEQQTNITFTYSPQKIDLGAKVSIYAKKKELGSILDELCPKLGLNYEVFNEKTIVLMDAQNSDPFLKQIQLQISGRVINSEGVPIIGATILIKNTTLGTNTDENGEFSIKCDPNSTLLVSYIGFEVKEVPIGTENDTLEIVLTGQLSLDGVTVLGSRGRPRTQLETVAPIDVINNTVLQSSPQNELAQVLQYAAPSFHSTKQNIGHGSDHIDPMTLRGLGADQTLVLINGKRRHATSLMNVNGTVGRGQVGTDLNSIPMAAVERIEVLRDGAAAQYGSDAIAGVINIVLKKNINKGQINVRTGFLAAPPEAPSWLNEFNPYNDNPDLTSVQGLGGGENIQVSANYGLAVGKKGGFLNMTLNYLRKNPFNRMDDYTIEMFSDERRGDPIAEFAAFNQSDPVAIAAYNERWGATFGTAIVNPLNDFHGRRVANMGGSGTTNAGIMFNGELPLNENSTFYTFGGYNYRLGQATGFVRRPNQTGRQSGLWPLGFSPHLDSDIQDFSAAAGVRSLYKGWKVDLSNTYGGNSFAWTIFNSNNASLGLESPTSFYAGGLKYAQNVIDLDVSRNIDVGFPLNTAFGAEFRLENFQQMAGQDESWQNYDGGIKEAGSQVFPGYQRGNITDKYRFNSGVYADFEAEFTKNWLLAVAGRFEEYSDFGNNFSWKAATRYRITPQLTVRGAVSTGFRAPSLPQKYFSSYTLQFITTPIGIDGVNIAHLNDDSHVTRQFGIENLRPETSQNISFGITAKPLPNLSLTIDAYQIEIKDRIGITGRFNGGQDPRFAAILDSSGLSQVQFMTNAVDTRTRGLDFVMNYLIPIKSGSLTLTAAGNFTETMIPRDANGDPVIKTGDFLAGFGTVLFNREEISRLEVAQPRSKIILGANLKLGGFTINVNATRFGEIQYIHPIADPRANAWKDGAIETLDQTFSPKILTDVDLSYDIVEGVRIGIGGSNIFNVYPDRHTHSANYGGGMFPYSRRVSQFGLSGAGFYGRLNFNF
ncbi:MAG: TonB-dependent receptor [Bacteroidia bacterium]|nr:TonB-dependent receptor [Bacteroidia bacterium]